MQFRVFRFFIIAVFAAALMGAASKPVAKASKVVIKTTKEGHYQLMVNNRPFVVRGVCYNPVPVGQGADYDFWTDGSRPWLVDGELMKKMGVNAVRFYQPGKDVEAMRAVIRDLYQKFGIRTILGHWVGFWNYPGPFYDDDDFRKNVKEDVLRMVAALKDEPGVLLWVLGNENNYSFSGKINAWSSERIDKMADPRMCLLAKAEVYYTLVNEIAQEIHRIDGNHPVAMGNGETICLDIADEFAKDVDIVASIIYRGKTFGNIFNTVKKTFDRPLLLVEFGADAYNAEKKAEDEDAQAFFLESQWTEIQRNLAGSSEGVGNCIGGSIFEWQDEWWKHNEWDANAASVHDTESNWSNGSYYTDIKAERNMNMNEEWFGIVRVNPAEKTAGVDRREPRKAYYVIREFWKNPKTQMETKKK